MASGAAHAEAALLQPAALQVGLELLLDATGQVAVALGKVELLSLDYLVGLCAKAGIPVGLKVAA